MSSLTIMMKSLQLQVILVQKEDMAETAFFLCAYEFAINNTVSPWCQLFDEEDAKVMEYVGDLTEYWKRGHGHDINFKSSCILFHDVFRRLDKAASQILSGQQDSEPLTSGNYATQTKRTFRTSHMLPYMANLVLVLYDCGDGELRVQPLLNEKTVAFPGLNGNQSAMPLFADVKERYKELLQGCDFETECRHRQLD
uniref:Multiple inositol polyphosphate phosphatase 1 n=1 Tax=Neogobius melanostomus TaxID=47308 RepID=A0A8C6U5A2_9GOBI